MGREKPSALAGERFTEGLGNAGFAGISRRADEGTRTLDLLHGKQSVQPSEAGFLPAKTHDLGIAALGAVPADPVEYGGVYVTNS
jgi:hypothetical protein